MRIHPPFPYYGGKSGHLDKILPLLPEHKTYVEVFGGSGAVLLNKEPAEVEVYNDIDGGAVNFFRVLRDNTEELVRRAALTPYSREEYNLCWRCWKLCEDPIERARMWFFAAATSFNGRFGHGLSVSPSSPSVRTYLFRVENLWAVARRFRTVVVENLDFREAVRRYDTPDTLFYLDPPYYPGTRDERGTYVNEMSAADHEDLVRLLLGLRGKAVLSGYNNPAYAELERVGWQKVTYAVKSVACLQGGRRGRDRQECLWLSPSTF